MLSDSRFRLRVYVLVVLATAGALIIRLSLDPVLGDRQPFCTFTLAVVVSAWFGGMRAALVTVLLGSLAGVWFFTAPRNSLILTDTGDLIGLLTFVAIGVALGVLTEWMRIAREEVAQLNLQLNRGAVELKTLMDVMPIGLAIARDPECRKITTNPSFAKLLGVTGDSSISKTGPDADRLPFAIFKDGREVPAEELPMQAAARGSRVAGGEYEVRLANGRVLHMLFGAAPVLDSDGRVRGAIGTHIDLTAHKLAEQRLRASEERFARFMQYLPGLAWIKDRHGRYVFVNDAAERTFGMPRAKLYGKTDAEIFPAETATQFQANDARALSAGTQVVETLTHSDGRVHHSLVSKFSIPDSPGHPGLIGGVAIDITDRKNMEEALQEADRRKNEFLATLAHELRNPLSPIRTAVRILQITGPHDPHLVDARDVISRQVNHMSRLIDDLLDVGRIARNKLRLRRRRIDLAEVIRTARETAGPLIESAGHRLTVELPAEPVWLNADPTRLAQVFTNLLTNAAKYTDRGGVIRLTADRNGQDVILAVSDNGVGIPAEHLPRLFELFSQVVPARERSQGGLGIGLALVRGLVEKHGGSVTAASAGLGRGSTFTVRLPVADAIAGECYEEPAPDWSHPAPIRSDPSRRILVIDDNRDAADSLTVLLRTLGHEVRVAYDGPTGLAEAARFKPDAVICDIGMPGMSGLEVARQLRADPELQSVQLVALTGWGYADDRRQSREAGFHCHMTKPVDPALLQQLLADRWQATPDPPAED